MKKKVIIGTILSIAWMVVIFCFSARSASELDLKNNFIVNIIVHIVNKNFDNLDTELKNNILSNTTFFVSKTAHFSEYAILGFFLFLAFAFIKKYGLRYFIVVIISFLYAISDEFHQSFSKDRTPRFQDVLIDTFGAIAMILFIEFILTIIRMNKLEKKND